MPTAPSPQPPAAAGTAGITIKILAATVVLSFSLLRAADPNLWIDEVISYTTITANWRGHLHLVYLVWDHPPLYFHLAKLLSLLCDGVAVQGAFPALCTAAAALLLASDAARGERGPLASAARFSWVALGVGLCPPVLYQAWNIRHYGLWLLLSVAYAVASRRWMASTDRPGWSLGPVLGGLALLTHHFTAFVILAVESFALVRLLREAGLGGLAPMLRRMALLAPFIAISAVIVWAQYPGSGGQLIGSLFVDTGFRAMRLVLEQALGSESYAFAPPPPAMEARRLGYALLLATAALAVLRRDEPTAFWLTLALVPAGILVFLSQWVPCLTHRFLLPSIAAFWAASSVALRLVLIPAQACAALACGVMIGRGVERQLHYSPHPAYHDPVVQLARAVRGDELVVLAPGAWPLLYEYYFGMAGVPRPNTFAIDPPAFSREAFEQRLRQLPAEASRHRRVWVVYELHTVFDPSAAVYRYFEGNWIPREYQRLSGDDWFVETYDNPAYLPACPKVAESPNGAGPALRPAPRIPANTPGVSPPA